MTRLLVAAVSVLAAAAAADALLVGDRGAPAPRHGPEPPRAAQLLRAPRLPYAADGRLLHERVLFAGREYLSAEAIEAAFPVPVDGPLHISQLTARPDETVALGIYRFPYGGEARGAIELWHRRQLVGAFPVPPGYFGGGLVVSRDARYVATFSQDGQLRAVFDRRGRRIEGLPESFLSVG